MRVDCVNGWAAIFNTRFYFHIIIIILGRTIPCCIRKKIWQPLFLATKLLILLAKLENQIYYTVLCSLQSVYSCDSSVHTNFIDTFILCKCTKITFVIWCMTVHRYYFLHYFNDFDILFSYCFLILKKWRLRIGFIYLATNDNFKNSAKAKKKSLKNNRPKNKNRNFVKWNEIIIIKRLKRLCTG